MLAASFVGARWPRANAETNTSARRQGRRRVDNVAAETRPAAPWPLWQRLGSNGCSDHAEIYDLSHSQWSKPRCSSVVVIDAETGPWKPRRVVGNDGQLPERRTTAQPCGRSAPWPLARRRPSPRPSPRRRDRRPSAGRAERQGNRGLLARSDPPRYRPWPPSSHRCASGRGEWRPTAPQPPPGTGARAQARATNRAIDAPRRSLKAVTVARYRVQCELPEGVENQPARSCGRVLRHIVVAAVVNVLTDSLAARRIASIGADRNQCAIRAGQPR